jgi:hypothetical protein
MRQKITEKVNTSPQDVKRFFELMPKDSLPTFNKEVEVGEIVFDPKMSKEEKQFYKDKAEELRASALKKAKILAPWRGYTHRTPALHLMVATWVLTTVTAM